MKQSSILKRHQLTKIDTLPKEGDCLCYRRDFWVSIQGLGGVALPPFFAPAPISKWGLSFFVWANAGDTEINIRVCPEKSLYASNTRSSGYKVV